MYKVEIEKFEGPLDLLLEIIESKKLPLHEISLAEIADQFLAYVEQMGERNIEELVGFLVIASRLALLKSRGLVPANNENDEPDGNIKELERQLALYQVFRRGARLLSKEENEGGLYGREWFSGFDSVFYFPKNLKKEDLAEAVKSLVSGITLPQRIPPAQIKKMVSLQQCMDEISRILEKENGFDFQSKFKEKEPEERLVHFLGVLEFVRLGKAKASQKSNFGTITLASV